MSDPTAITVRYFAHCGCGWRGPKRDSKKQADADGKAHARTCTTTRREGPTA